MRLILITVLLLASGSAWARPDVSFDLRYGSNPGHHKVADRAERYRHKNHKKQTRQIVRSLSGNHRLDYRQHKKAKTQGYHQRKRAGNWVRADQFRTRRNHASDPVIHINARVSALGLTGLKRGAQIRQAYVEFGNGAIVPLYALEGGLRRGSQATRFFKKPRYVKRIMLRVAPAYRHKRAYVGVDYLLVGNGHARGTDRYGPRRNRD